eukprot:m51a1_g8104 hypothetical protein (119) ;mRNA; r:95344-95700
MSEAVWRVSRAAGTDDGGLRLLEVTEDVAAALLSGRARLEVRSAAPTDEAVALVVPAAPQSPQSPLPPAPPQRLLLRRAETSNALLVGRAPEGGDAGAPADVALNTLTHHIDALHAAP